MRVRRGERNSNEVRGRIEEIRAESALVGSMSSGRQCVIRGVEV